MDIETHKQMIKIIINADFIVNRIMIRIYKQLYFFYQHSVNILLKVLQSV